MAYPFSDMNLQNPMPEIDMSSLMNYGGGNQAGGFQLGAALVGGGSNGVDLSSTVDAANVASQGQDSWYSNLFNSKSLFGGTNTDGTQTGGWAMPAISILSGVLGMQQNKEASKLAKNQLAESKRQFDLNFGAQRKSINTELEDRQRARVASAGGSGAYESVDSYLQKNRI